MSHSSKWRTSHRGLDPSPLVRLSQLARLTTRAAVGRTAVRTACRLARIADGRLSHRQRWITWSGRSARGRRRLNRARRYQQLNCATREKLDPDRENDDHRVEIQAIDAQPGAVAESSQG